ncbi:hypothetical protein [Halogeometricum sp. CBA1124]|uniref:hypothetical protein n=1 Tax=Halogeometricum sp. CBA1124 TaxID=2668071 RepID=UPI00174E6EBF|nr:hypothetical protein [Halogeometricum sp. CBA1124]
MTRVGVIYSVALADFRARSRTSKLLVVPVLIAYLAKVLTVDSMLVFAGEYTGAPTAAWYGGMVACAGTTVLLVFGGVLVDGSIERDRTTGVDHLVATAPIPTWQYIVGKWLSNVAVLTVATGVLAAATAASFLVEGTGAFDLVALASPFVLLTLPAVTVVAAAAVCFETVRPLRGSVGTAVYFALALAAIAVSVAPDPLVDIAGIALLRDSVATSIAAQFPSFGGDIRMLAYQPTQSGLQSFRWDGLEWSLDRLAGRARVLAVAVGFLGAATVTFDRFDDGGRRFAFGNRFGDGDTGATDDTESKRREPLVSVETLTPVESGGFAIGRVLAAEFRMALRGRRWWWYLAFVGGVAATAVAPLDALRAFVLPIVLLLPLPVWSRLGARERLSRTTELVFVDVDVTRLLACTYVVAVGLGAVLVLPALVRFAAVGSWDSFVGGVAAVAFLPSLALALGVWTGRPRLFELLYLVAWYLGPVNGVVPLDYTATMPATTAAGVPAVYLLSTAVAFGVAVAGRRREATIE